MTKLILKFMVFMAALWGIRQVNLPTLLVGIALVMTLTAAMHLLATPENYDG